MKVLSNYEGHPATDPLLLRAENPSGDGHHFIIPEARTSALLAVQASSPVIPVLQLLLLPPGLSCSAGPVSCVRVRAHVSVRESTCRLADSGRQHALELIQNSTHSLPPSHALN